jgi:DNA-directed RNA polymerase specialized sigma24 family protein
MVERMTTADQDGVLEALELLSAALAETARIDEQILQRIAHIREQRTQGRTYAEIVPAEPRPLIVEMLSVHLDRLATAGNRIRRREAQALYDEGLTMDEIATLFGVSRQRIGTLLHQGDE